MSHASHASTYYPIPSKAKVTLRPNTILPLKPSPLPIPHFRILPSSKPLPYPLLIRQHIILLHDQILKPLVLRLQIADPPFERLQLLFLFTRGALEGLFAAFLFGAEAG
jgi:hypothetical protein